MNKVINGRYYDTAKAKEILRTDNGFFRNDCHYYEETLYQKANGEYFMYMRGGGRSPVAHRCGINCYEDGEAIKPASLDEAKQWVAENFDGETYISLFGEVEQ